MDKPKSAPSSALERSLKDRSALDQLSHTLTTNFDLEQLLGALHRQLTQLLEVDNFYVALLAPQREEIWYPMAIKNGLRQNWPRRSLADRLTDRVILTGKPILLPHHANDRLNQIGLPSSEGTPCAWIGVPLITSEQTIGCLALYSNSPQTEFTEADLHLLVSISGPTSIAIQVALRNILLTNDVTFGHDRLAIVLNSVGEGIAFIEYNGRISLANLALEKITGYSHKDYLGKSINEIPEAVLSHLGLPLSLTNDIVNSLRIQGQQTNKTSIRIGERAQEKYLERTVHPVKGASGQDIGWLIVLRDVSEEQQARNHQDLISETLIHDLRSPISAVLSAIDVVEDSFDGNDLTGIVRPSLQIARRSANRALGMIESMLEIARFQAGEIELHLTLCNLHELSEQALAEFSRQATEYKITLVNDMPKDLPGIRVDQGKIIRVLTNLIENAIKFTPAQGAIHIRAEMIDYQYVEVQIRDTGPGIPEDYLEKIFDRFSQVPTQVGRKRGSGLGLPYCRMAIEAHGGRIWAESYKGSGSIFHFTLPIDQPDS
jgi:NtrC-family two-component system sensor histidine kinase KinB